MAATNNYLFAGKELLLSTTNTLADVPAIPIILPIALPPLLVANALVGPFHLYCVYYSEIRNCDNNLSLTVRDSYGLTLVGKENLCME